MHLADAEATERVGRALGRMLAAGDVIALHGALGSGKTTLARGMLRGLGFAGDVASPTFPIVQVYDPPDVRVPVWHVDLYRIEARQEIEELGLEDAREGGVLIVEWPERLGAALWGDSLILHLAGSGESRSLTAEVPAAWEGRWPLR